MSIPPVINRVTKYVTARPFFLWMTLLLVLTLAYPLIAYHWKKWALAGVVARLIADVSPWIAAQWTARRATIVKAIVDELFTSHAPPPRIPPKIVPRPTAKKPPRSKRAHAEVKRKRKHAPQAKH